MSLGSPFLEYLVNKEDQDITLCINNGLCWKIIYLYIYLDVAQVTILEDLLLSEYYIEGNAAKVTISGNISFKNIND